MSNDSKLLINEHPLQVLPTLAKLLGLNEAIILQQIHYWLVINSKQKDNRKFKDGRWWVYNAYKDWQENNFPWWSVDTVKRAINRMEEAGILVSMKPNASDWDHTKWYTIDYEVLNALSDECILPQSVSEESTNRSGQDDTNLMNLETTTEITSETSEEEATALIFQAFESWIGPLTGIHGEILGEMIDEHGAIDTFEALKIGKKYKARHVNYIVRILENPNNGTKPEDDWISDLLDEVFNE